MAEKKAATAGIGFGSFLAIVWGVAAETSSQATSAAPWIVG